MRRVAAGMALAVLGLAGLLDVAKAQGLGPQDARVWLEGGRVHSTECIQAQATVVVQRKLAMAAAAKAIVRWRDGVGISGQEHLADKAYTVQTDEDAIGVVRRLEVLRENSGNAITGDIWCVTVAEQ